MQLGNKILLIEDDKFISLALKIRLQSEGYVVTSVYDCAAAMKSASEEVPDIALIDCNLPDGNGIEVMQEFLKNQQTSGISSIIMTASNKQGLKDRALAAGAFSYFQKPFNSAELIESIKEACEQAEQSDQNEQHYLKQA